MQTDKLSHPDTVVLAPAGYLLDPDVGSDYERPWRLAQGLSVRGLRVIVVAREVRRAADLGRGIEVVSPPGSSPTSPLGRLLDRVNLYWYARQVADKEGCREGPSTGPTPSQLRRAPTSHRVGRMP